MYIHIYIYIYIYILSTLRLQRCLLLSGLHPVSITRFPSFRTQPPESLSHYPWKKSSCVVSYAIDIIIVFITYHNSPYTRSPSQDFRLFGPRPWKVLATAYETNGFLSNPDPGESLVSGNLAMETRCSNYNSDILVIAMYSYYY